jgi:outer membrane biosynthesis protein TonB
MRATESDMRAVIDIDGRVHDLKVVSAPWPSMATSALIAVSHWKYKPYMLNGKPVVVHTTINAIFRLHE